LRDRWFFIHGRKLSLLFSFAFEFIGLVFVVILELSERIMGYL
jgi:hypothetical protein